MTLSVIYIGQQLLWWIHAQQKGSNMPDPEEYIQTEIRRSLYELPPPYSGVSSTPPPPPKKNLKVFVLVIIGILCITIAVLSGLLIAVLRSAGQQQEKMQRTPAVISPISVLTTPTQYYTAIEHQEYTTAYSYMAPNLTASNGQPLTQELYTTAAQALDTVKGQVTSYSVGSTSVSNNVESVTVIVTRGRTPAYDVHLQLQQINGSWKITSYDNI
jgi:hypothetical protein